MGSRMFHPRWGGHSKLCRSRPKSTREKEVTAMIVDCSLSLKKYCYSVTMVSGSFPTRRWGCQDMGRLIDLASGNFESKVQRRQLCLVPCPAHGRTEKEGWAMQTRTSFTYFACSRPRALGRLNNVRHLKFPWNHMCSNLHILHGTPNVCDTADPSSISLTPACS